MTDQSDLFESADARSLLDQLLDDSKLYQKSEDYLALLDFTIRLRNFAPFNAMLLHIQKPGLRFAASSRDWWDRFERTVKDNARPLLILWPFGPVALVYDALDTEGKALPEDVSAFPTEGAMTEEMINQFGHLLFLKHIALSLMDAGDNWAGRIQVGNAVVQGKAIRDYLIQINKNHDPNTRFATLAHELGHLFLGHLVSDKYLSIPKRLELTLAQQEVEAESVAYLVCTRHGVKPKSQTYLSNFVSEMSTTNDIDLYQVMRAAGQVETILGLAAHAKFDQVSASGIRR